MQNKPQPRSILKIATVTLFSAIVFSSSCKKDCIPPNICGIEINSSDSLSDTSVVVERFTPNYGAPIDTTIVKKSYSFFYDGFHVAANYNFSSQYSYIINVLPAGKSFRIKNIHTGNEKMNQDHSGSQTAVCVCSYSYWRNDTIISVPWQNYSSQTAGIIELYY